MHKHTHPVKSRVWWSETATIPAVVFSAMRERLHRLRVVRRVDGSVHELYLQTICGQAPFAG